MVSLQGTIETFAIADVLRLLAATSKSGRLQVQGPARSGTVWVDSGNILSAESPNTPYADQPADVLFQLLRFDRGSFRFELDRSPTQPTEPIAIETALHDAEAMVSEFRELEQSIPSIDAWISLSDSLPDGSVTISSEHWRGIKAIGSGRSVAGLGDVLALGELPVYRAVNELLNLGVVDVGAPPADAGSNEAPASSASTLTAPDTPPPSLMDDDESFRSAEASSAIEPKTDEHVSAVGGSGPIATSLSTPHDEGDEEGSSGEGGARRRLDALASSLGLPTSPENGSAEAPSAPPPSVPAAGPSAFTSFAPPPPAETSAAPPAGARPEAGLTSSADSNGSTEAGTAENHQNGVVASSEQGTEYVGSAAEGAYGESTRVGPPAGGPAYGDAGEQQPAYGQAGEQQPAYGDYGQPQPAYGDYGQPQPTYGDYGQQHSAYGEYGQSSYGEYGQQPAYGDYGQPQQPAYGDYGQQAGYPAPPAYGYEGYGDAAQAYAQPSPEAEAPVAPGAEPSAETQTPSGEVQPGSDPTRGWPISDEANRARSIFESTAPPPPPPPPSPTGGNEGWPTASGWFDGPAPERIAPPPPPPPPPVGIAEPAATSSSNAQGGDEDAANIERQLFNLSDRAREAVKRSSGLFEGRSRR